MRLFGPILHARTQLAHAPNGHTTLPKPWTPKPHPPKPSCPPAPLTHTTHLMARAGSSSMTFLPEVLLRLPRSGEKVQRNELKHGTSTSKHSYKIILLQPKNRMTDNSCLPLPSPYQMDRSPWMSTRGLRLLSSVERAAWSME